MLLFLYVQFVNFTELMSKNMNPSRKEAEFALSALMEIPSQYKATLELNILGFVLIPLYQLLVFCIFRDICCNFLLYMNCVASASRGKGIDRVSLPPPHYGAASFSTPKASRSGSFQPSAPSSSARDPVSRTTHSGSQASENHVRTKITYLQSYCSVVRCLWSLSRSIYIALSLQLCPICITEPKDMAFGCGHQVQRCVF